MPLRDEIKFIAPGVTELPSNISAMDNAELMKGTCRSARNTNENKALAEKGEKLSSAKS